MHRTLIYAIVLTLFFVVGCVNYLQTKFAWSDKIYPGPYKARDQIAILVQNESQTVHLEEIDGSAEEKKLGVVFELLPGRHVLCVRLSSIRAYSKKCQMVEFAAQAGHSYEFYGVEDDSNRTWYPAVRDITDELSTPSMEGVSKKIEAMMHNARSKQAK